MAKVIVIKYHFRMKKFLLIIPVSLIFLLGLASFTATNVFARTSTPTVISTKTSTLAPHLSSFSAALSSSVQISHSLSVALSEIEQVRFTNADTIAYLQWGTVYTHNLSTQKTDLLIDSGDVNSFDWSASQQQFVVVQNGRLYLLDGNGTLIENLSKILPPIHPDSEFVRACSWNEMTESDNLLEYVKWVKWNPEEPNIIFGAANIDDYITHDCGPKIWSVNIQANKVNEIGWFTGYNPEPRWLNKDLLLLFYYTGGGSYEDYIIDISTNEPIFRFGGYAGFTQASASGVRLARISEQPSEVQVWNISPEVELLWSESLPSDTLAYHSAWSADERYLVISQEERLLYNPAENEPRVTLFVLDLEGNQKWQPDYGFSEYISPTWLPGRNEILIFHPNKEGTSIYIVNPVDQSLTLLRTIPQIRLAPIVWSSTNRYLVLGGREENRSIWLWNNDTTGRPFLLYKSGISDKVNEFTNFIWSTDDMWLVFVERSGAILPEQGDTNITLRALHISTGQQHQIAVWEIPKQ